MIGTDVKGDKIVDNYVSKDYTESPSRISIMLSKFNDKFHRFGLWCIISICIGIYAGVTASKLYYNNKMTESIAVGGMVFEGKVYTVSPK